MATSIHFENLLGVGQTLGASGLVASSTASGYNKDNVRDPNLFTGWRGASGTTDEDITFELASALSTSVPTYYGIALDARDMAATDRTEVQLQGSTGGAYTTIATLTYAVGVSLGKLHCFVGSFTAASAYTFFRFNMNYSGAGTDACPIVHYVGLCTNARKITMGSSYDIGPARSEIIYNLTPIRTTAGAYLTNRATRQQYQSTLMINGLPDATLHTWRTVTSMPGASRPCFAIIDGQNEFEGTTGGCVIRFIPPGWSVDTVYNDVNDLAIPFATEPYSFVRVW